MIPSIQIAAKDGHFFIQMLDNTRHELDDYLEIVFNDITPEIVGWYESPDGKDRPIFSWDIEVHQSLFHSEPVKFRFLTSSMRNMNKLRHQIRPGELMVMRLQKLQYKHWTWYAPKLSLPSEIGVG